MANNIKLANINIIKPGDIAWHSKLKITPANRVIMKHRLFSTFAVSGLVSSDLNAAFTSLGYKIDTIDGIQIAVGEQIDNSILHGCRNNDPRITDGSPETRKEIFIHSEIDGKIFKTRITAPCSDFDFRKVSRRKHFTKDQFGGWGTGLTRIFSDLFKIRTRKHPVYGKVSDIILQKKNTNGNGVNGCQSEPEDYFMGIWQDYGVSSSLEGFSGYLLGIFNKIGYSKDQSFKIFFSLKEAIANAIVHGCLRGIPEDEFKADSVYLKQLIAVSWRLNKHAASFIVSDPGSGFDPLKLKLPSDLLGDTPRSRGRGIYFIRNFMDEINYVFPEEGGTMLQITKVFTE